MQNRFALGFLALTAWLLSSTAAWAVALGKIDVTSHLGEPFFAEVPLQLDAGEKVSSVDVDLASPSDYRILEIYRDPALGAIQTEIKNDKRGPRVVISSKGGVNTPFFNLVLKVRYDRATHFKKYPVFLDIPKAAMPAKVKPEPTETPKQAAAPATVTAAPAKPTEAAKAKQGSGFTPYDGWARIGRYGPLVYGDNVSTVAQRLRIDNRFTMNQVIVAIFEKNRSKFSQNNVNLVRAGSYLDVPKAAEVARISPAQASRIMAKQNKAWKQLIKQPKYAAIAEAQKHRYSKRVRMGTQATGVPAAPGTKTQTKAASTPAKPAAAESTVAGGTAAGKAMQQQLQQLQQQNADLQDKLNTAQKQLSAHQAKANTAAAAATDARIKKLEIELARLKAERDQAMQKAAAKPSPLGWLTYALAGVIVLLLAVIGVLMRRERAHPATYAMPELEHAYEDEPESETEAGATGMGVPEPEEPLQAGLDEPEPEADEGVPDLTEEETGSMEAFQESSGDQPDPNVDYLAESDVYLRYGMDDEAIQQVRMALQLDAANVDAHIKMAQLLRAKGDEAALTEATATARQALQDQALDRFEQGLAALDQGEDVLPQDLGAPAADIDLADLDVAWSDFEDAESAAGGEPETAPETEAVPEAPAADEAEADEAHAFDLSDLEFPATETEESAPAAPTDDLDKTVAIGSREIADALASEPAFDEAGEASPAETGEEAGDEGGEPETPSPAASPIDEEMDLGDFDFDQSDLEQAVASASEDEFTSTIRTTLSESEESDEAPAASEDEAEAEEPALDLSAELEAEGAKDESGKDDDDGLELDDVEVAHDELNSLLEELADESEKDDDGKKS